MNNATPCRRGIILDFAKWTALSATRSGAPIKSRLDVYAVLEQVHFPTVLNGTVPIPATEFDHWHEETAALMRHGDQPLVTGWAVKLLNIYLKTAAYVGELGRPGLRSVLHPPIDGGLWAGLAEHFGSTSSLVEETNHVMRIKDITDYSSYKRIIAGCRLAATELGCDLIEVEQLWQGTRVPAVPTIRSRR